VSPVRYELDCYFPEDDILHSHPRDNFTANGINWPGSVAET
jgi:hypothetical protein